MTIPINKLKRKYSDLSKIGTDKIGADRIDADIDNVAKQFCDIYLSNEANNSSTNYDASDEDNYDILSENNIISYKKIKISKCKQQISSTISTNSTNSTNITNSTNSTNIINSLSNLNQSFDEMEKLINNKLNKFDSQIKLLNRRLNFIYSQGYILYKPFLVECSYIF